MAESLPDAEVDPDTWRLLTLQAIGPGDDLFDIQLLRPLAWIDAAGATIGGTIHLAIPEQGLDGPAEVLAIEPCPAIETKPHPTARIVTGTFTHHRKIFELSVAALDEPIGTTNNHPFWSVDRQEFVLAADLTIGEILQLVDGTTTTVTKANHRRGPPERVYNLEVDADHTYHVTDAGVLVHNNCTAELQPFRDDVFVKGVHADIFYDGKKISEARLEVIDGVPTWYRWGDKTKNRRLLLQADKTIAGLADIPGWNLGARMQVEMAIEGLKALLKHGTKKQKAMAERSLERFEELLDLL